MPSSDGTRPVSTLVRGSIPRGLRKNATAALYEAGCTPQQVQGVTGHKTLQMVQHYGRGARQERLAKQAMAKWEKNID